MIPIQFNFKDFEALGDDLQASRRAIPIIVQRVMQQEFRAMRDEFRMRIPAVTGGIRRHFSLSVRRRIGLVRSRLGFIARTTQRTAIAANVRQHGSNVHAKKRAYLWIPFPGNRKPNGEPMITPRDVFIDRRTFFLGRSKAGNLLAFRKVETGVIPMFLLKKAITVKPQPLDFEARVIENQPAINRKIEEVIGSILQAKGRARSVQE